MACHLSWGFIKKTLCYLAAHRADFLLVGGVSAFLRGGYWPTTALSLWYRPDDENRALLVEAIRGLHPHSRGRRRPLSLDASSLRPGRPFACEVEGGSLLLVDRLPGLDYEVSRAGAEQIELQGTRLAVISLRDLLKTVLLPQVTPELAMDLPQHGWRDEHCTIPGEFFPETIFEDAADLCRSERKICRVLGVMDEPFLGQLVADGSEQYRALWLPTRGKAQGVRVAVRDGEKRLIAVRLSGSGERDLGEIEVKRERLLTEVEWSEAQRRLARPSLWAPRAEKDLLCLDGTQWILEQARPGLHRGVQQSSPAPSRELHQAAGLLLRMASGLLGNA